MCDGYLQWKRLEREWRLAKGRGDAAPFPAFDADPRRFGGVRVVHDPRRSGVLITVPDTAPANATPGEINAMIASQFWAIRVPDAAPYPAANMDRRRLDLNFNPSGIYKGKDKSKRAIEQAKSKYQRRASRGDEDGGTRRGNDEE